MNDLQIKEYIAQLREIHPDLVVIIYGPTATGKSGLSLRLADLFAKENNRVEIISADSRQVYRGMDIGTDKISQEDRNRIPHYAIDLVDPDEEYSAHQRQQDTRKWISDIHGRRNLAMIVGGTGLYIDTIYKNFNLPQDVKANRERRAELDVLELQEPGYLWKYLKSIDPDTAAEFHPRNTRYLIRAIEIYEQTGIPKSIIAQEHPVDYPLLMISLSRDRDTTKALIRARVEEMIERGLIQEVQWLLDQWYSSELQSMNGIGYRQTVEILNFEWWIINDSWIKNSKSKIQNLIDSITLASVQYAKRQRTRFRRYQKDAREHPKEKVFYLEIEL